MTIRIVIHCDGAVFPSRCDGFLPLPWSDEAGVRATLADRGWLCDDDGHLCPHCVAVARADHGITS